MRLDKHCKCVFYGHIPLGRLAGFPLVPEFYSVVLQNAIVLLSHDDPFQASMACMQIVLNPQEIIFFSYTYISMTKFNLYIDRVLD